MNWTTARQTAAALTVGMLAHAAPAGAQPLYSEDGIQFRASVRPIAYAASECNVLENHYSPESYERMRENQGQPLHVWEYEATLYNGSGRELSYLYARVDIDSPPPPCTNWSEPDVEFEDPVFFDWGGELVLFQRVDSVAPGEALTETGYLVVFHTDEPAVGEWNIRYLFADADEGGGPARRGASSTRSSEPAAAPAEPGRAPGGVSRDPARGAPRPRRAAPAPRTPAAPPVRERGDLPPVGPAGMEFVWVPAGEFRMGSTSSEAFGDEQPVTQVRISEGFWLGKYEVTQEEWQAVMGSNPSRFSGCGRCPVEMVSWDDAQEFISRLNAREGREAYRLPTEAEWEYAARAGTAGDRYGDLNAIAWYDANSDRTHPVGQKTPNAWGLHDMLGNVWEWVGDWFGDYPGGTVTDPRGPGSGSDRVYRGGGWYDGARYVRAPNRRLGLDPGYRYSLLGLRLLRTP